MSQYLFEQETYQIIGILFEVHKNLGKGFSEIVYKDALEFEFKNAQIPFEREKEYAVNYKDTILKHKFYADFIVFENIILEIKSCESFSNSPVSQCLNYLKVSGNELAILANFNKSSLEHKRIVLSKN
ncbi:GxxExxY protein [Flavobacterium frigoris]|uniref:NADH:ubiquinone oxidoreductase subunit 5 n=1 Tax=Flavobacterium frigoris (strain PS1) TaxID=1086011 RepID=H7FSJ8_FLAFP|nr:GxxExxY protein [Flavobacterium frigoris]EIA08274.1 NADH:ubiquinone oxidoreductase subunit 5 [Flavobacterium frigoris PS1]